MGEEKAKVESVKCVSIPTPSPHIYRCGTRGLQPGINRLHLELPLGANEEPARGRGKSVGPYLVQLTHLVWLNQVGHQLTSASCKRLASGSFGPW
jgi:hypothetical protein